MKKICLNDILDAISIKINALFGDEYTIYTNNVKQGFNVPSFYIKLLPQSRIQQVGNRYYNETKFVIHVFLKEMIVEELNNITEKLYNLEYIELANGDILRGTDMSTEINDSALEFFIDYNFFTLKKAESEENMQEITINGEVK